MPELPRNFQLQPQSESLSGNQSKNPEDAALLEIIADQERARQSEVANESKVVDIGRNAPENTPAHEIVKTVGPINHVENSVAYR